jgi:glycosyltransferase involved in cell wall biosynthesis
VRHLFVVPGWYPHEPCFPLEGAFIREQAQAIAELHPERHITLSLWDQGLRELSSRHLGKYMRKLVSRPTPNGPGPLTEPDRSHRFTPYPFPTTNIVEARRPAWSWDPRWLGGNRDVILAANRDNLDRATASAGSPDVIHAHVAYPAGWIAMHLGRERGIPYIVTEHMGPFPLPRYRAGDRDLSPLVREPLENARAVIAVSPVLAGEIEAFGIRRPRFIPNLVDESQYPVTPFRTDPRFTFYTLGAMLVNKGISDLIHAAAKLMTRLDPRDRERVRFRIGGDGRDENRFRAEASRLGLGDTVEWLGLVPRDQARAGFRECDCFVLPSHHESFGIVLTEALASGRPVIATRCGGPESIVRDGTGILVPVGDVEALTQALQTMLKTARSYDPYRLREEFMSRFSRQAVVGALDAVYTEALTRDASTRKVSA